MLLCADAQAASAALASGVLACPSCGIGRLRPWGHGREREIRVGGGQRQRLRPRRGLCRSCGATHILLPSWAAPRRADAIGVIARAAALSVLHGTGSARLGAQIGVPAGTVRGWLRRLRARAGPMLQEATASFGLLVAVIETVGGPVRGRQRHDPPLVRRDPGRRCQAESGGRAFSWRSSPRTRASARP